MSGLITALILYMLSFIFAIQKDGLATQIWLSTGAIFLMLALIYKEIGAF